MNGDKWYVLQLKPNGLDRAVTHLERQGYKTLMPLREVTLRGAKGMRQTRQPLFPGYIFFSSAEVEIPWVKIGNTRGISRIVTNASGKPAYLPPEVSQELLLAVDETGMLKTLPLLKSGDQVSVVNGPFSGWLAEVAVAEETDRVRLLVDLMGRHVPVVVDRRDIEKRHP